jgi:hypothetical protein
VGELTTLLIGGGISGGLITLLTVLTNAVLKAQKQTGEQQAYWRAIVDEKDKQILRLENIIALREAKIANLEARVTELEKKVD